MFTMFFSLLRCKSTLTFEALFYIQVHIQEGNNFHCATSSTHTHTLCTCRGFPEKRNRFKHFEMFDGFGQTVESIDVD